MRIGIVCFASIGGSSTVACSLARHLVKAGHTVFMLTPARPERLQDQDRVLFRSMPTAGDPRHPGTEEEIHRLAEAIAWVVAEDRLDIVHAHYAHPHAVAAVSAGKMVSASQRPTVVATLHGTDVTGDSPVAGQITEALLDCDGVSAVSSFLADNAAEVLGIPRPVVIPNFIDRMFEKALSDREKRTKTHGDRVLVHISTLRPVKRAIDCVGILSRVNHLIPSQLIVVGDGPDADAMRLEAYRLGVADRVVFAGATPRIGAFLAKADLLLLPSASESFGMVALEAMAAGVPVIGTLVKGLADVAEDGVCARLLPVGDLDSMAEAACELLMNQELASAYANAGRCLARNRYAPENATLAYTNFYNQAMSRKSFRHSGGVV
jgi:N-acetyl-alpha-D-glucosaminyl L-malate synthase BshA